MNLRNSKDNISLWFHNHPKMASYMWRKRDYKLILSMDKSRIEDGFSHADLVRGELYNLNKDPQEWNNIFYDEKHKAIRQTMSDELMKHLEKHAKPPRRARSA